MTSLEDYIDAHTSPAPDGLVALDRATNLYMFNPRMSSGHVQGRLLKMLVQLAGATTVLEIGAYSGYSTLCLAEGLPRGGHLHTIEVNDELKPWLSEVIARYSGQATITLHLGDALKMIPAIAQGIKFDVVFIDADKRQYAAYYEMVKTHVSPGGLIIADNTLWDGHVLDTLPDEQTAGVMLFNDLVRNDPEVEVVMIPMRDGLSLIRKK